MSQNSDNTVRISPPMDARLVRFLEELSAAAGGQFQLNTGNTHLGTFNTAEEFKAKFPNHDWETTRIITQAGMGLAANTLQFAFHRRVSTFGNSPGTTASNWENEISCYPGGNQNPRPEPELVIKVWDLIDKFRISISGQVHDENGVDNKYKDAIAYQVSQLADLQLRIMSDVEAARLRVDEENREKTKIAEESIRTQRENDVEQLGKERGELQKKSEDLDALRKELDDRGHMHARRQLRNDITKSLKDRLAAPGVSTEIRSGRMLFLSACVTGMAIFLGVLSYGIFEMNQLLSKESQDYTALIIGLSRVALPGAAFAGLLFYMLAWLKQIHSDDTRSERDLERYRYDLDRASWVIETVLEVQEKEAGEVPSEWIHGVTHNLFSRSETKSDDQNPLEALGSLLNVAAKAEFGPGGPKIQFERKGLRKMGKLADDAAED